MPYDTFSTYGGEPMDAAPVPHASTGDIEKIRFMVVSGFLGAGKTTTMIALGEYMNKAVGKVGIIANDLGANLVDTNLTQTRDAITRISLLIRGGGSTSMFARPRLTVMWTATRPWR